jgi:hypothetical protein
LRLSAALDKTIGTSLLPTARSPTGSSSTITAATARADYAFAPEWTAVATAGYVHTDFIGVGRHDDAWSVGTTLTYSVWQNFGLTLDIQHIQLASSAPRQSFSREIVTFGVSYKY